MTRGVHTYQLSKSDLKRATVRAREFIETLERDGHDVEIVLVAAVLLIGSHADAVGITTAEALADAAGIAGQLEDWFASTRARRQGTPP